MAKKEGMKQTPEEVMDATATEVEAAEKPQGLALSDVRACVTIIDIVTKRGAFEGSEMAEVGLVRNRLDAFLKAADAATAKVDAELEETTAE
tara:strand:+ start:501 stop:776 length:276 start_codon:yes stop_codon:yes gene_type:complete